MRGQLIDPTWDAFVKDFDAKQEGEPLMLTVPMRTLDVGEQIRKEVRALVWRNGNHRTAMAGMAGAWAEELGDFEGVAGHEWNTRITILYNAKMLQRTRDQFNDLKHKLKQRDHAPTTWELKQLCDLKADVGMWQEELNLDRTQLAGLQDQLRYPNLTPKEICDMKTERAEHEARMHAEDAERRQQLENLTI